MASGTPGALESFSSNPGPRGVSVFDRMAAAGPDAQPATVDPNAAELDLDDAENPQDAFDRKNFVNVFVQGPLGRGGVD